WESARGAPGGVAFMLPNWFWPSFRNSQSLSCSRMTAVLGTTRRGCSFERKVATAYIFGRKDPSGLGNTIRTFADRMFGSRTREMLFTFPWRSEEHTSEL